MISRNLLTFGLFGDTQLYVNKQKYIEKKALEELNFKKIIQINFPENQYYKL